LAAAARFCEDRTFRGLVARRFTDALEACIREIPPGRAATCGTVARALGDVRAARAVAAWLVDHPDLDPEGKVVRADGSPAGGRSVGRVRLDRLVDHLEGIPLLTELRSEQERLARRVQEADDFHHVRTLGGADVAYIGNRAFAAAVTLDATSLEVLDVAERELEVDFPYIPSYLAFRELPAIEAVVNGLKDKPDVLLIDGHGRLHPIRFGFACYAGVTLDRPTIGIAKHPLVGKPVGPHCRENEAVPIEVTGEVQGYAWIPPRASRAFYVSVGNRITLDTALRIAQGATRDRYPEPLRVADRISKEGKRKKNEERNASGKPAAMRTPAQGLQGI